MNRIFGKVLLFVFLILLAGDLRISIADSQTAPASDELSRLREMLKGDRSTADALVLYPDDVRTAIFRVSTRPDLLEKVAAIQQTSSAGFDKITSALPEQDKRDVWEIVRHPGLVKRLIDTGQDDKKVQKVAAEYESPLRETILRAGKAKTESEALVKIDVLDHSTQEAFVTAQKTYPPEIQEAIQKLIGFPETLALLTQGMNLTILVGEVYKQDPAFAERRAREVGEEVRQKNAKGIEDWKMHLESTPQAFRELEQSVRVLATERDFDPAKVLAPVSEKDTSREIRPYPYWYGFPKWHPESYWYPYRYWHYCGYFYSVDGNIVLIGTPSAEYLRWHFQDNRHLSQYPYLTDQLLRYYESHSEFNHTFNAIVGKWMDENRTKMPGDWLNPDADRVSRLRKYDGLNQPSLTQQAQSMSLNTNQGPAVPVHESNEALKLTLPSAFDWQSQAEEYHQTSWDPLQRQRDYQSKQP